MSDCKIYPADTVDIYGNVWPTVGENIRNGIFGENVKVGYVNIDKGNITSRDFTITDKVAAGFKLNKVNAFIIFPVIILSGGINITIANSTTSAIIRNTQEFSAVTATLKIIYKDII